MSSSENKPLETKAEISTQVGVDKSSPEAARAELVVQGADEFQNCWIAVLTWAAIVLATPPSPVTQFIYGGRRETLSDSDGV